MLVDKELQPFRTKKSPINIKTCGMWVIVSAVGNNDVTVLGQKNLIDAAKQQGVKRFIPADYLVDYPQLSLGRQRQPGYAEGGV